MPAVEAPAPTRADVHELGFGYGPELLDELTRMKLVHLAVAPPVSAHPAA